MIQLIDLSNWSQSTSCNVIHLQLYVDEFGLSNPLSANKNKYKTIGVYFTILNLPPSIRYLRSNIFLCILSRYSLLTNNLDKYNKLFSPLISDLSLLQDGINIILENGNNYKFKALLSHISCDNLSANEIGGFRRVFNSGFFCRFCLISYEQFRDNILIENLILRNEQNYNNHINYLQSDDKLTFGIRNKCNFSKLNYFKPYEKCPPDLMHDLIEGVIPLTIYKVLMHLKADNLISIDSMNNRLSLIDFPINKNIPLLFEHNIFTKRNHLKGTASQHLELF